MKRRDFFAASAAAGLTVGGLMQSVSAVEDSDRQLIELRTYLCPTAEKKELLLEYLRGAAVPAWNRQAIRPVGILTASEADNGDARNLDLARLERQVFVILPHATFDSVLTSNRAMLADAEYREAAEAYFSAPMADALCDSYESALMIGFDDCPRVEAPTTADGRVFQLRIYESHQEERALKKVDMFNEGGEIAIFRKCGMHPVLFGEQIVGPLMPNLTYILGFDSKEARAEAWATFLAHPDWTTLKNDPQYKDTVSRITNIMLRPAMGSQI